MEYAEKGSLYDIIHRKKQKLTYGQVLKAAKQIALGLNYLHLCTPKIIHRYIFLIRKIVRDLKTANIVLDNAFSCKLADFGISREATSTMTGLIIAFIT